jgi:hypothetical protein
MDYSRGSRVASSDSELAARGYSDSTVAYRLPSGQIALLDFNPSAVRRAIAACKITGNRAQRRRLRAEQLRGTAQPAHNRSQPGPRAAEATRHSPQQLSCRSAVRSGGMDPLRSGAARCLLHSQRSISGPSALPP